MGQGAAKPPIRMVLPASTQNEEVADSGEDEEDNNIDKLGVSAEESFYPEPKPPHKSNIVKEDRSDIGHRSGKTEHETAASKLLEGEVFSTKSIPDQEYEVELVPVGASFQNSMKKRTEIVPGEEGHNDDGKRSYPVVKTITRSLSLRDSLLGSSLVHSGGLPLGMTKREAMLAERERYEYLKLMVDVVDMPQTHRGQLRRFNFDNHFRDSHAVSTEKFRNVEDRLADEIADKHRDHRAETYSSLVKDLTLSINSDRLKVKIILAWISKQGIGRIQFGSKPPPPDTPNGYMMLMQVGQGTYPAFFALLCRAASINCAIISGISKGSHYDVGSNDTEHLKNHWNAVYVEGSWQLVHPLWVCKGVANRQLSGWVRIEEEGKTKRKFSIASIGRDVPSFNPYFIFTKPEEFICRNFPDEEHWQLLPHPITLDEFLKQTYIRPIFYINQFKLESVDSCMLESEGEANEIKISFPKQKASDLVFGYELNKKVGEQVDDITENINEKADNSNGVVVDLADNKKYVMVKKSESSVIFEVRYRKTGTYKLRLYGGYFKEFGNKPPWIMDVLLKCNNVLPEADPLPFDPGPVGWGPGPISENCGLYVPSHVESEVNVTEEEDTIMYFILHEKVKAKAELFHCNIASNELKEYAEASVVAIGDILTLQIRLMHPGKGEFGLKITITKQQMDVNACNYIVHTSEKRPFEPFYQRRARRMLLNAMETCDIDFLRGSLDECKNRELPDTDPDVMGARNRFEFLSCKTELYVALLVNRIDVSEHALYRTRKANLDILLAKEMTKVEEHLQKLQKLDEGGWTCEIPEIDRQSLVELSQLRKPKLEVRLVITTMYMLLGIEEENLKDWGKVRKFLRNQQSTLIEMARLEKYLMLGTTEEVTVAETVLDRVQEILTHYTEEDIRRVDNTAAAYFQWVITVMEKLRENRKRIETTRSVKPGTSKSSVSAMKSVHGETKHSQSSMSIKAMSLRSKASSGRNKSQNNDRLLDSSNFTGSHALMAKSSLSQRTGFVTPLKLIKEEGTTSRDITRTSREDLQSVRSALKTKSFLSVKSETNKSHNSLNAKSQTSKMLTSGSKEQSAIQGIVVESIDKASSKGKSATSLKTSKEKALTPNGVDSTPTQGSIFSLKSFKAKKSQVSVHQDTLSKTSGSFLQDFSIDEKRTPVSSKVVESNKKSVKSILSRPKTNELNSGTDDKRKNSIKHIVPATSDKTNGISGKTFFSDASGYQRGQTSRPVSKKQTVD